MHNGVPWLIAAAITLLVAGTGAGIRLAVIADAARRARAREAAAAVAQYRWLPAWRCGAWSPLLACSTGRTPPITRVPARRSR